MCILSIAYLYILIKIRINIIDNICLLDIVTRLSLANSRFHEKNSDIIDILTFNATIIMMAYLLYFRRT